MVARVNKLLLLAACATTTALHAAHTIAYVPVCCNSNSTVSIINTAKNKVSGSFAAGPGSYSVAFPNAGTAWVTNAANKTISVVALASGTVRKTIQLKLQPWLIVASPDGSRVYVVTGMFTGSLEHYSSTLQAFDSKTFAAAGSAGIPNDGLANPGLVVSPDGSLVYATFDSQTIIVYNVASGTVTSTWQTTRALTWTASGTLTLSPDGGTLYTAGQVLTAIDTANGAVKGTVTPPGPAQTYSFVGSAVTADGSTLYASYAIGIGTGSGLATIDTASLTVTGSAGLGSELQQPVLSKDGATLYVPDAIDSAIYVVGVPALMVTTSVAVEGPIASATLNASGSALYVPNSSTASTVAVDTATLAVTATIGVSGTGNPQIGLGGTTNPGAPVSGGNIFVGGIQSNSISAIHTATHKVSRVYTDGAQSPSVTGVNPPALMVTPNGQQIYLAASDFQGELTEIDTATGAVNGVPCNIGGGCWVTEMGALPDSSRVYLAGFGQGIVNNPPFFYVVDTATLQIVAAPKIKTFGAMAAAPSGTFLYIAAGPVISIFDTAQNAITGSLPISGVDAIAFSPDGSMAYAATGSALESIDTTTGQVTGSISLGSITPTAVSVTPDGRQAWVTPSKSTSVVVVDLQNNTTQTVNLGLTVAGVAFGAQ